MHSNSAKVIEKNHGIASLLYNNFIRVKAKFLWQTYCLGSSVFKNYSCLHNFKVNHAQIKFGLTFIKDYCILTKLGDGDIAKR